MPPSPHSKWCDAAWTFPLLHRYSCPPFLPAQQSLSMVSAVASQQTAAAPLGLHSNSAYTPLPGEPSQTGTQVGEGTKTRTSHLSQNTACKPYHSCSAKKAGVVPKATLLMRSRAPSTAVRAASCSEKACICPLCVELRGNSPWLLRSFCSLVSTSLSGVISCLDPA